jgi:dimethylamine/trimethylamine dehydrogenase
MGRFHPNAMTGMSTMKAEGGWGIVCAEQCDFPRTSPHQTQPSLD